MTSKTSLKACPADMTMADCPLSTSRTVRLLRERADWLHSRQMAERFAFDHLYALIMAELEYDDTARLRSLGEEMMLCQKRRKELSAQEDLAQRQLFSVCPEMVPWLDKELTDRLRKISEEVDRRAGMHDAEIAYPAAARQPDEDAQADEAGSAPWDRADGARVEQGGSRPAKGSNWLQRQLFSAERLDRTAVRSKVE